MVRVKKIIVRKRWEGFCRDLGARVGPEGEVTDEALIQSYNRNFGEGHGWTKRGGVGIDSPARKKRTLKRARALLRLSSIQERLGLHFEEATGYTIVDAARRLVDHIEGRIEKQTVTKDGQIITSSLPPSLPALLAFMKLTVPAPAGQVHLRHSLDTSQAPEKEALPRMEARILSASVEPQE